MPSPPFKRGTTRGSQSGHNGRWASDPPPLLLPPAGLTVTALALGDYYTCAIVTGGGVKCWGRNNEGQLGVGPALAQSTDALSIAGAI